MSSGRDFWSRRRAEVEAEEQALEAHVVEAEVAKLQERPDEEILAELNLPEPEALESADAVRDFLKAELPQRLKTRALRRLWRLNPLLANLDGLVDYGEDYTDAATVIENMQTVYQVGKGMVTAFLEDEEDEAETVDEVPAEEEVEEIEAEEEEVPLIASADPVPLPDPEPEPTAMPQRRMRFAFDTA
ncbi:DUF3306 domain-containing protein [uncultured Tateyamaria sp.]|uniref:DUF3306 domain-containing protein n=1 Tax=uncultured Tateyamaria sp. TaxID=455651 RepID=UPI00262E9AF2|nr:DUF3306 domain-containing protein [uncultured Tateyamaria sp.]